MNRDDLIKRINEELKDHKIERGYSFDIEYQIKNAMKGLFDDKDFEFISVGKQAHSNTCYIRYKNHYLFSLKYTKTKGEYHRGLFETYYDYYYKDFICGDQDQDFDLKRKMYEIEIRIIDEEEAKDKQFKEMTENYKKVFALFGDNTRSVLAYFERHKYSLEREIKKDETNI